MSLKSSEIISSLKKSIEDFHDNIDIEETGYVLNVGDGIAQVHGISNVRSNEVIRFESGSKGIALNLDSSYTNIVILDGDNKIKQGDKVFREKESLKVPVGKNLLGRIVNSLGKPIDDKGDINSNTFQNIESEAPGIIERQSINEPLYTGIKIIDSLIPIGKGQRELIIGDRQLGKTSIAIDCIINQKPSHKTKKPVYCIYVSIGQKCSNIAYIAKKLEDYGSLEYTTIVNASASDSAAMQFLAPYTGCAMGEFFRDRGMHVLVVYDDLSKHAIAYRQISLLLKRPPGREAYPGDIFFIHSKLLERSAKLSNERGGGSLTALPIVETQSGDISSYIPTNVISITDGQIFLEEEIFNQGIKPAINIGLSVSRVGSAAQKKAIKTVAGKLKLQLAQYRELKNFSSFGSEINKETQDTLDYGAKLTESMKQPQYKPILMENQVITLYSHLNGYTKNININDIKLFEEQLIKYIKKEYPYVAFSIADTGKIENETELLLKDLLKNFVTIFLKDIKKV